MKDTITIRRADLDVVDEWAHVDSHHLWRWLSEAPASPPHCCCCDDHCQRGGNDNRPNETHTLSATR